MRRRHFLSSMVAGGGLLSCHILFGRARGQATEAQTLATDGAYAQAGERGPIIDVHMHAYPANAALDASLPNPATGKPHGFKDGHSHMRACLAEMKRLNIVKGVVSGGSGDRLAAAMQWHEAAPDRIIAGAGVRGSADTPLPSLEVLRKAFADGKLRVLGEVTAQYAGLTLSDPQYAEYLALAEEFDIPVAVHMGMAPARISYDPCCRNFRARFGNPALIEEGPQSPPEAKSQPDACGMAVSAGDNCADGHLSAGVCRSRCVRMGPAARRVSCLSRRLDPGGIQPALDVRV